MATSQIRIENSFLEQAKIASIANHRPLGHQVQYWAMIGQIAEENPDLTFNAINSILQGDAQLEQGKGTPFVFQHEKQ